MELVLSFVLLFFFMWGGFLGLIGFFCLVFGFGIVIRFGGVFWIGMDDFGFLLDVSVSFLVFLLFSEGSLLFGIRDRYMVVEIDWKMVFFDMFGLM